MEPALGILILGAVVAGFVQGLSGFAFSLVALSFWAWGVEPTLAATLAILGGLAGQITAAIRVRRGFGWRLLAPFLVGGVIGVPIGVAVLPMLDVPLFKALLGGLLVTWCPAILFATRLPRVPDVGRAADGLVGLAGGILGGIVGSAGAIPTLWTTLRQLERDHARAVVQNFNLVILALSGTALVIAGRVTREVLPTLAIVIVAMLVPALIGMRVYIGLSEVAFRRVVLTCLTASGLALLASSLPTLLARA